MEVKATAAGRALVRIVPQPGPLATECWQWPGAKSTAGYSYVRVGRRVVTLHRLLYEVIRGPVPSGRELHHRCEDKGCVNPHHLEPLRKPVHGLRHRRKVCVHGHSLAGRNRLRGGHGCRRCYRERKKRRYHVLREAGFTAAAARNRA
jgi:hypothetical protein